MYDNEMLKRGELPASFKEDDVVSEDNIRDEYVELVKRYERDKRLLNEADMRQFAYALDVRDLTRLHILRNIVISRRDLIESLEKLMALEGIDY